jgi:hypothetical protein
MNLLTREIIFKNDNIIEDNTYSYNTPAQYFSFLECSIAKLEHLAFSQHTGIFISQYEIIVVKKNSYHKIETTRYINTRSIENLGLSKIYKKISSYKTFDYVLSNFNQELKVHSRSEKVTQLIPNSTVSFQISLSKKLIVMNFNNEAFEFLKTEDFNAIKEELTINQTLMSA